LEAQLELPFPATFIQFKQSRLEKPKTFSTTYIPSNANNGPLYFNPTCEYLGCLHQKSRPLGIATISRKDRLQS
jgi:hypothetical protein